MKTTLQSRLAIRVHSARTQRRIGGFAAAAVGATLPHMPATRAMRRASAEGRAGAFEIEGRDSAAPIVRGRPSRVVVDVSGTALRLAARARKAWQAGAR